MQAPDHTPKDLTGTLHEVALREVAFRLQATKDFLALHTQLKDQELKIQDLTLKLNDRDTHVHELNLEREKLLSVHDRLRERDAYVHELHLEREKLLAQHSELRDAKTYINQLHLDRIELDRGLAETRAALESATRQLADVSAVAETLHREKGALDAEVAALRVKGFDRDTYIHDLHVKIETLQSELRAERLHAENFARRLDAVEMTLAARDSSLRSIYSSLIWLFAKPFFALQRKLNPIPVPPAHEALPAAGLSYFLHTALFNTDTKESFEVRGWVFSKQGKRVEAVRARVDQSLFEARYHLNDEAARAEKSGLSPNPEAGFTVTVTVPRGKSRLFLEANINGEGWRAVVDAPLWRA